MTPSQGFIEEAVQVTLGGLPSKGPDAGGK